jgi:putative transposase
MGNRSRATTPLKSGHATRFLVTDLFFRPLFAFFLIELKSRKVIHVGVTGSPPDPWVARTAARSPPYGHAPKYLIRANDSKCGSCFARVARTSGIKLLKTPVHAPRANAICERFLRSVRQECLVHLLILHEKQHKPRAKSRMWSPSTRHDPRKRMAQQIPERLRPVPSSQDAGNEGMALAVMGGLHHDDQWAS